MSGILDHPAQWIIGFIMVLSALGVLFARRPVHASLSFLLTLLSLATFYLQLSASFIAVMQVLVYGGAILVTFIFVIVLFQDAHDQIERNVALSSKVLTYSAATALIVAVLGVITKVFEIPLSKAQHSEQFGHVEGLGKALYLDFFFPFEAVIALFLVAIVGAFYIGNKET